MSIQWHFVRILPSAAQAKPIIGVLYTSFWHRKHQQSFLLTTNWSFDVRSQTNKRWWYIEHTPWGPVLGQRSLTLLCAIGTVPSAYFWRIIWLVHRTYIFFMIDHHSNVHPTRWSSTKTKRKSKRYIQIAVIHSMLCLFVSQAHLRIN